MTSKFYDRRFQVELDGVVVLEAREGRQFKATFEILQDFGAYNSFADLALFNLADETKNLFKKDAVLTIKAGYVDAFDVVFKGPINNIFPDRQGATPLIRIFARGGRAALGVGLVNTTFGKNTTVTSMIKELASTLDYPLVMNPVNFSDIAPYARGYVMSGDPRDILNTLAKAHDFHWTVENGRIIVLRSAETRLGVMHVIDMTSGMEGRPSVTETGVEVSTRLNPSFKIGDRMLIKSMYKSINFGNVYFQDVKPTDGEGEYKIQRMVVSGDTFGDAWTNTITGIRGI